MSSEPTRDPRTDRLLTPANSALVVIDYAQMQVVEQAISTTKSLDDAALVNYTRDAVFKTVIGEVKFARSGEWSVPRVLQVQFRDIHSNDPAEFKDPRTRVVLSPGELASGELIYPYADAKRVQ